MYRDIVFFTASENFEVGTKWELFREGTLVVNVHEAIPAGTVGMARRSTHSCHGIDVEPAPARPLCQPIVELNGKGTRGLIKACVRPCHLRPFVKQAV